MNIKITNVKYDLVDEETNPDNDILAKDFDLPTEFNIDGKTIKKLFGDDFDAERDIAELIESNVGFCVEDFDYEVID